MNILITAGNAQAPIDRVRVITNIFSGKTGAALARTAWGRGHKVTILTSHPETLSDLPTRASDSDQRVAVVPYSTFDDLAGRLQQEIRSGQYDVVFHSAAVTDYLAAGVYAPAPGTFFNARTRQWERQGKPPNMTEHRAGKINSSEPELWLRLVRAPKLIDRFRGPWGFEGMLVKFKLEVGIGDAELVEIAERSRLQSAADLMVANTLDGAAHYAFVGPVDGRYERVARRELADRLLLTVEHVLRQGRRSLRNG